MKLAVKQQSKQIYLIRRKYLDSCQTSIRLRRNAKLLQTHEAERSDIDVVQITS